jgi:methylthioribose-1-phosphate isomerase
MAGVPHPDPISGASYSAVELLPDDARVVMLDQRRLPLEEVYLMLETPEDMAQAIRQMAVRGAPAIGIAAAYAMVLAGRAADGFLRAVADAAALLKAARPTAVNLAWAVDHMLALAKSVEARPPPERLEALSEAARHIHREDVAANRRLGQLGAERIPDGATVLTHCNAGALATGGYGTALGVVRAARDANKRIRVIADETRPFLQGSRLTAWELSRDGIDVEVIADASAGWLLKRGAIDLVIVGADRIAQNGDVANKIGTYTVACMANAHSRPFYVAAPWSTVDEGCESGDQVPIEERDESEVTELYSVRLAPPGVHAKNPAFDLTPARLVTAIFTERGVIEPVGRNALEALSRRSDAEGDKRRGMR